MGKQMQNVWNLHKKKILLAVGMMMSLLLLTGIFAGEMEMSLERLHRPSIAEGSLPQELIVVREDGSRSEVQLNLKPRTYSEEEAMELFAQAKIILAEQIKGENVSLELVESDLYLPEMLEELGMELIWSSESPELVRSTGELPEDRTQAEAVQVKLQVLMRLQGNSCTEGFTVTVLPPKGLSWEERLSQELSRLEANAGEQEQFELPAEFEGEKITFVQQEDMLKQTGVALLPVIIGLFFYMKDGKKTEKQQKQRQEEIMTDYPEVIVKMTVLYQAGMSMRNVWERIAADEKKKGGKLRPIYEEIAVACNSMADGVPETEAYRQFGRRCSTAGCLKLGNMLAGNVRRGTRHLTAMMAEESARAWGQRKHLARRSGEKAGTKMLLPMFMMFGVVLAMVVVPAFNGFV